MQDINSRVAAAWALGRLMPDLTREEGDLLTSVQRAALHKFLNTGAPEKESELMLTIIDSLTRIEDVSALQTMEAIARRVSQTLNERTVVKTAASSANALREAKQRLDTPQILLRASEESTAPAQLLRAVSSTSDSPTEQLLRAGDGGR